MYIYVNICRERERDKRVCIYIYIHGDVYSSVKPVSDSNPVRVNIDKVYIVIGVPK